MPAPAALTHNSNADPEQLLDGDDLRNGGTRRRAPARDPGCTLYAVTPDAFPQQNASQLKDLEEPQRRPVVAADRRFWALRRPGVAVPPATPELRCRRGRQLSSNSGTTLLLATNLFQLHGGSLGPGLWRLPVRVLAGRRVGAAGGPGCGFGGSLGSGLSRLALSALDRPPRVSNVGPALLLGTSGRGGGAAGCCGGWASGRRGLVIIWGCRERWATPSSAGCGQDEPCRYLSCRRSLR